MKKQRDVSKGSIGEKHWVRLRRWTEGKLRNKGRGKQTNRARGNSLTSGTQKGKD